MNKNIVFLAGCRTPFAKFNGSYKNLSAIDLGAIASREAIKKSKISKTEIDSVIFGNALQTSRDAVYLARHIGLICGLPAETQSLCVNRIDGSGFQAILAGTKQLMLGEAKFVLCGGTENMTQAPHIIRGTRDGISFGKGYLEDYLWASQMDTYTNLTTGMAAEKIGEKYEITRDMVDEYASLSTKRWFTAYEKRWFSDEVISVEITEEYLDKKELKVLEKDEYPNPEKTLEYLKTLKPVIKESGLITRGNSSNLSDGACALVMTTEENAKSKNLSPLGRLVSWGVTGCDPYYPGMGVSQATKKALEKADLKLDDIDVFEINEAYPTGYLAVEKELDIDREKTNLCGGAIAVGHPLAASGARIALHLLLELRRQNKKYGLGTTSIAGGQGIAVIVAAK